MVDRRRQSSRASEYYRRKAILSRYVRRPTLKKGLHRLPRIHLGSPPPRYGHPIEREISKRSPLVYLILLGGGLAFTFVLFILALLVWKALF